MLLPLLGDVEDDLGDLPGLVLGKADLLAELVVPLDDLALLGLVPITLAGPPLGFGKLVGDLHAGGYEIDDLLVYRLNLGPKLFRVGHRRSQWLLNINRLRSYRRQSRHLSKKREDSLNCEQAACLQDIPEKPCSMHKNAK